MTRNDKQWYIFRHGLATHSKTGYGDRILTAEVLPEGIPPVRRLATHLMPMPYDYGAVSAFLRCQQTAAIVTEITGRTFVTDERLNEAHGETIEQVRDRVADFVESMLASPYQHLWVCTHGIVIAALKHLILEGEFLPRDQNDYIQPGELLVIRGQHASVVHPGEFV
jgi:broad specificity phosphatase PhoE